MTKRKADPPKLLLAESYNTTVDPTGWWMSEKLDGVRSYWDGSCFQSREGNLFYAPKWFTDLLPNVALDGELWMGREQFQATVSCVKKHHPIDEEWKKIKYCVWDCPNVEGSVETRWEQLKQYESDTIQIVKQIKCENKSHLDTMMNSIVKQGGEGVMLRKPCSLYEGKRSKTLLKYKPVHDAEATIIGYEPGKGRNTNKLGAYRMKMDNGIEFSLGSGLTDHDRENKLPIGTVLTYQYSDLTKNGVPRFPRFLRLY